MECGSLRNQTLTTSVAAAMSILGSHVNTPTSESFTEQGLPTCLVGLNRLIVPFLDFLNLSRQ